MRIRTIFSSVACLPWVAPGWAQVDCLGVDGGTALPGTPCADDNPYTAYALWSDNCECQGYCVDWDMPIGIVGGACDDHDPTTVNDLFDEFCQCGGTPPADDCQGVFMGSAWPGTACDDGNPLTFPDVWSANCECVGDTVGSNTVSGLVFLDLDGNGAFDGTDLPVENRAIMLTGANYTYATFSGAGGQFSAQVWTDVYTLTVAPGPWDAQAGVPPAADVMGAGMVSAGHMLPLAPASLQEDLGVVLDAAWWPARPGFENVLHLFVRNMGTVPLGGTLTLIFDPLQEHVATGSGATVVGNTITWAIPELALGQLAYREVWLSTPLSVPLGTLINHQAVVQTLPPDADPGNDVALLTQEVVGSWDPNDKMVMPVALAPQDVLDAKAVQYTIRFQNTGTWYAEDVLITDTNAQQQALLATLGGYQQAIHDLAEYNAAAMQLAATTKALTADNVKAANAGLGTSELIETNQKQVNEIYLSTIAKEVKDFTTEQTTELFAIADQCPMVGGNAVYRARALYSLIDEEQVYDDEALCLAHGIIIKRLDETVASTVSVIPNPASDEATLVLTTEQDVPSMLIIFDAIGSEVARHTVPAGSQRHAFSTAALAPALYHYKVLMADSVIGNGKLTIVR